jgi:hypothetical protein
LKDKNKVQVIDFCTYNDGELGLCGHPLAVMAKAFQMYSLTYMVRQKEKVK